MLERRWGVTYTAAGKPADRGGYLSGGAMVTSLFCPNFLWSILFVSKCVDIYDAVNQSQLQLVQQASNFSRRGEAFCIQIGKEATNLPLI